MMLRRVVFMCCFFKFMADVKAQPAFGIYHASQIPQQTLLNPAFRIGASAAIGFPGLSGIGFQYYNSSFTLKQLLKCAETSGDSSTLNLNKVVQLFGNRNYLSVKAEQQWLFAAFRYATSQWSFHVTDHASLRFKYPKDLFRLLVDGNGGVNLGNTFNLKFSLNAIHYREYGIAYSREIKEHFIIGGRIKFLKGFTLLDASRMKLNLNTDANQFEWTATANLNIHAASTGYSIINKNNNVRPINFFRNSNNPGLAADVGILWQEHPRLTLSAALLDFGFINWKTNAVNLRSNNPSASFRYKGLPIQTDDKQLDHYIRKLKDSINQSLGLDTIRGSFSKAISTQFLCGMQYVINSNISIQTLIYGDFFNGTIHPALHAGINWQPIYWLSIMAHNTAFNNIWLNPGLGISINAGRLLFYASSEHAYGLVAADQSRSLSLKFGVNILWNKDKRSIKRIQDPELPFMQQKHQETKDWGR